VDDRTKQENATVLAEMFLGLGKESTVEKIAYYLRLLGSLQPWVLRKACDAAVLARSDDWIPGPGEINRQARRILGEVRERERETVAQLERENYRRTVLAERASGRA